MCMVKLIFSVSFCVSEVELTIMVKCAPSVRYKQLPSQYFYFSTSCRQNSWQIPTICHILYYFEADGPDKAYSVDEQRHRNSQPSYNLHVVLDTL